MHRAFNFLSAMRQVAQVGMDKMFHITIGELTEYDPLTHSGMFRLPLYLDDQGNPIETGKVPCATPYAGNNEGAVFPIATGAQALILFLDSSGMMPLAALFLFNGVDKPPFTDGKTYGWLDASGTYVKTTNDTKGKGVRLGGQDYGSLVAKKVELGAEGLTMPDEGACRYKDLKIVVDAFNSFVDLFNNHIHSGVQPGGGNSLVPTTQGTHTTTNGSGTVAIND